MHGCDGVGRRQNVFAHKYMWAHLSVCLTPPLKNKKNLPTPSARVTLADSLRSGGL